MATAVQTKSVDTMRMPTVSSTYKEPKRLSKAGLWRRENPGGILIVKDRRAVNR